MSAADDMRKAVADLLAFNAVIDAETAEVRASELQRDRVLTWLQNTIMPQGLFGGVYSAEVLSALTITNLTNLGYVVTDQGGGSFSVSFAAVDTPVITAFNAPAYSSSLTITLITPPLATDNVAVTGYIVTVDDAVAPVAADGRWGTAPTTVTAGANGTSTLRAYARDGDGNVSAPALDTVVVDTTTPTVTFVVPATNGTLVIPITTLTSTFGPSGSNGYIVTVNDTNAPLTNDGRWGAAPATVTVGAEGSYTLRAYSRSNAGLVSAAVSQTCTVSASVTTLFSDTFEGTTLGASWQLFNGASITVGGGLATRTDFGAYRGVYTEVPSSNTDYTVTWVISHSLTTAGYKGFVVRSSTDWFTRSGVQIFWQTPGTIQIADGDMYTYDSNNITPTINNGFPASWSVDQEHTVRIRCAGSTISVYLGTVGAEEAHLAWQFTSTVNQTLAGQLVGVTGDGSNASYSSCVITT